MGLKIEHVTLGDLSADPASPPDGCFWHRGDLDELVMQLKSARRALATRADLYNHRWDADQLLFPNSADWPVNALAAGGADSNNAGIAARLFDKTIVEGVGTKKIWVPAGTTRTKILTVSRAEVAPPAERHIGFAVYSRRFPDNAARTAWSSELVLADRVMPTSVKYDQNKEEIITHSALGIDAGKYAQFEFVRRVVASGTNLDADWSLSALGLDFLL